MLERAMPPAHVFAGVHFCTLVAASTTMAIATRITLKTVSHRWRGVLSSDEADDTTSRSP